MKVYKNRYKLTKPFPGVFLIPYAIIMIVCGVPMLYMELSVGQYTGRGPIGALGHLCPLLKGTTNTQYPLNLPDFIQGLVSVA